MTRPAPEFEIIRDPLWDNIRLDRQAVGLVDTSAVQRLRYVRQLGHAFLVYPGATHTRFEHALGAWHLARRALAHADPAKTTVTNVATGYGFWELGRFSVAYRKLFGEAPSTTLHREGDLDATPARRPLALPAVAFA